MRAFVTAAVDAYAVDARRLDRIVISVAVFSSRLVERVAYEAVSAWPGTGFIDTHVLFDQ